MRPSWVLILTTLAAAVIEATRLIGRRGVQPAHRRTISTGMFIVTPFNVTPLYQTCSLRLLSYVLYVLYVLYVPAFIYPVTFFRRCHPYARTSASRAVLGTYPGRMQLALHATRPSPHGASLRAWCRQAMFASSVTTRHAPSRHCRDANAYGSYNYNLA